MYRVRMKTEGKALSALRFLLYFLLLPYAVIYVWDTSYNHLGSNYSRFISSGFRLAIIAVTFLYVRKYQPGVLQRFRNKVSSKNFLYASIPVILLCSPSWLTLKPAPGGAKVIFWGIFGALLIGVTEELLSRGAAFAYLEKYGVWTAAVVSSIQFGLLHLTNFLWGGQSFWYTLAQMLSAFSIGLMFVGLMLYTRTIWFPIVFHALIDAPILMKSKNDFQAIVTSHPNIGYTLAACGVYATIAMIYISKAVKRDDAYDFAKMMAAPEQGPSVE